MKKNALKLTAFSILTIVGCSSSHTVICRDKVEFMAPQKIGLNHNEDLLVCGDETRESWKDIPPAQSEFHLRTFLSQRAYFEPKFEYKDGKLLVDPGVMQKSHQVVYVGAPEGFDEIKLRDVLEVPLTSEVLDTIEGFTLARLKNMGYACPDVKVQAVKETGIITVTMKPGPQYTITEPTQKDTIGLYEKTLRRFDAFALGAPYRYEWMRLSAIRAETDGIVVSSQLLHSCPQPLTMGETGLKIHQDVIGGEKRLVTVGVGASTEEIPIAQLSWKSVRMDPNGSNLNFTAYGSQRQQKFKAMYAYFLFKNAPRFDLSPTVNVTRANERTYQSTEVEATVPLEYKGDAESFAWLASIGPGVSRVYSDKVVTFATLLTHLSLTTHDYELYLSDPRSGHALDFSAQILTPEVKLQPLATLLTLTGSHLFQINPVDPPQWILGFRYMLSTTVTDEKPGDTSILPAQYFLTLGGDQDLRGFGRDEITNRTVGGLTAVSLGTEIRYAKTWVAGIEPFLFFDIGALGSKSMQLDSTFYYSPGLGIRWATPFGAIRSTIAHGYLSQNREANGDLEHIQFFISFGKEF
jgi:translocation and assembly module TamA